MSQNVADILFSELIKNPEDLDLFLTMHNGFVNFHKTICAEFLNGCIVSKLRSDINTYNDTHKYQLEIMPDTTDNPEKIYTEYVGVCISSNQYWPEKLIVYLETDAICCKSFNVGVSYDLSKGGDLGVMAQPFEQSIQKRFDDCKTYKKGMKYVFCDFPSRNWNTPEMVLTISKDVAIIREKGLEAQLPTADRFVDALMAMVDITDQVVEETGQKRS
jgi:hypothetical protein